MVADLTSLAFISLVAVLCPIIASLIPGRAIPETVLLLLAGALLGPHGAGLIAASDAISLLSDLGLAFLFLLAGYEISPKNLTGTEGRRGAGTWAVTFAIAFLIVAVWPTLSVFELDGIAVVIALTTTAMGTLLPILQERGILGTRVGTEIIAYGTWGELFPILAMTVLLSARATWQSVVILFAFLAIALVAAALPKMAAKVGTYIHKFIVANANTNAQMVIRSVNLLLIGLTAISAVFDLDIVLGAFAAGFILRFLIPEGNQTMEMKHNAIAYGFLVPLFFVVSGAKIDVRAVFSEPELLVLFIVLLLLVRAVPIYVSLSLGRDSRKLDPRERLTVAFYCTTALPIIVAVTTVAVSAEAMSQQTASVLVAAGGVTVFLMPLLASAATHTMNADLGRALRNIRRHPKDALPILRAHRRLERQRHAQLKGLPRTWGPYDIDSRCPGGRCERTAPSATDVPRASEDSPS
ncbi:cation:proton antiporter [uncultured Adlercreutzia sp.]|uniref:cation:proton antiporter n=1 Tax=uncultured Adlercreutzia sp. TaxID=875803 RepID=UPI0025EE5EF7|nr:cation:proton antiporter [uncultured Adlercreutzia sp.]